VSVQAVQRPHSTLLRAVPAGCGGALGVREAWSPAGACGQGAGPKGLVHFLSAEANDSIPHACRRDLNANYREHGHKSIGCNVPLEQWIV